MLQLILTIIMIIFGGILFLSDTSDTEEKTPETEYSQEIAEAADSTGESDISEFLETEETKETEDIKETEAGQETEDTGESEKTTETAESQEVSESQETENKGNSVKINIPDSEISGKKIVFNSVTLENREIDQSIFSEYDITVVHVWGTFCGPCIAEMGGYAEFYNELPENVNLVAIVCDTYDGMDNNVQEAEKILNNAGAGFTNIRVSDDLYNTISSIQYVPTSFLVDREGHIIGHILEGAGINETRKYLNRYLE